MRVCSVAFGGILYSSPRCRRKPCSYRGSYPNAGIRRHQRHERHMSPSSSELTLRHQVIVPLMPGETWPPNLKPLELRYLRQSEIFQCPHPCLTKLHGNPHPSVSHGGPTCAAQSAQACGTIVVISGPANTRVCDSPSCHGIRCIQNYRTRMKNCPVFAYRRIFTSVFYIFSKLTIGDFRSMI